MDRLAIIISEDSYDKLLCPFVFAYLQSIEGTQVDIFFVSWAVRALTPDGARAIRINGHHAGEEPMVRKQVASLGLPSEVADFMATLKETGCVSFYCCDMAAKIYGVTEEMFIDKADQVVSASWFLHEKVMTADHCQYF
ncbi:MAG: DsrE family protein [Hyphomicrobiales bacterium]|nr:DsrE family protein [Hyphomicrobiales bacterium]